jgi:nucleobase:cation symporter-1, NCS1 family
VHKQKIAVDDLFTRDPAGAYHYRDGFNPAAIYATVIAATCSVASLFVPV